MITPKKLTWKRECRKCKKLFIAQTKLSLTCNNCKEKIMKNVIKTRKPVNTLSFCRNCKVFFRRTNVGMCYCSQKCKEEYRKKTRKENHFIKLRFDIFKRDNFTCQYCGRNVREDGVKLEIDHIIPTNRKGKTEYENLITSCKDCNLGKSDILLNKLRGSQ